MEAWLETSYGRISTYCVQKITAVSRMLGNLIFFTSTSPSSTSAIPDNPPPPSPPPPSVLDLEAAVLEEQNIDPQPAGPVSGGVALAHHVYHPPYHFDLAAIIIAFCLTSAVEIALQSLQPQIKLPPLVHLLSLAMMFAFASTFVSSIIAQDLPNFANALILMAKLSIFTAFFLAITVPFSFSLKIISWSIFGLCLLIRVYAAVTNGRVPQA